MRAAAARVVSVAGLIAAAPILRRQLPQETSGVAAIDQVRALSPLLPDGTDALALEAAGRFKKAGEITSAEEIAVLVARARGPSALKELAALAPFVQQASAWSAVVLAITEHGQQLVAETGETVLAMESLAAWNGVLSALGETASPLPDHALSAALGSHTPEVQAGACWAGALTRKPDAAPQAQSDGQSGLVVIEAIISTGGCVVSGRVVRSAGFLLDVAAIKAVSQWRYEPARVDDVVVPVVMTVTVQFTLGQ